MGNRFAEIAFTDSVKALQVAMGSRAANAQMEGGAASNDRFSTQESSFIASRDSFYMASVSETGWPYVQHRGGPAGFLRVLDQKTLGFADFRGNRQYVSVGNLTMDNRVSLFLMDYPRKARLKILGRARMVEPEDEQTLARLALPDYRARVERGVLIDLEGFDWNCPQHITPRFTQDEIRDIIGPLQHRIVELQTELERLRGSPDNE